MWNNDKVVSREYVNNVPMSSKSISVAQKCSISFFDHYFSFQQQYTSERKNNKSERFTRESHEMFRVAYEIMQQFVSIV